MSEQVVIGYELRDKQGSFFDCKLGIFISGKKVIPVEKLPTSLAGTKTGAWIRKGGLVPIYKTVRKREAEAVVEVPAAPPVPSAPTAKPVDWSRKSKPDLVEEVFRRNLMSRNEAGKMTKKQLTELLV